MSKWDKVILQFETNEYITSRAMIGVCGGSNKASRVLSMLRERGLVYAVGTGSQTTLKQYYLTDYGIKYLRQLRGKNSGPDFGPLERVWNKGERHAH